MHPKTKLDVAKFTFCEYLASVMKNHLPFLEFAFDIIRLV